MEKILPIGNPPIICALHHAYPLSILSQSDDYLPWFYSHYIQVEVDSKWRFNFYRYPKYHMAVSPWLQTQILHRNVVRRAYKRNIDFVKDCLDENLYVQIDIDEFYLSNKENYRKIHYTRELLVFGYDLSKKVFNTVGFGSNGVFTESQIGLQELEQGILEAVPSEEIDCRVRLFRYIKNAQYNFDLKVILEQLQDYFYSVNTSQKFQSFARVKNYIYGMATYGFLREYIKFLTENIRTIDIILFHTLWEHKECMKNRLFYLETNGYLDCSKGLSRKFKEIVDAAYVVKVLSIKFYTQQRDIYLHRILSRIDWIEHQEKSVLELVCRELELRIKLVHGGKKG